MDKMTTLTPLPVIRYVIRNNVQVLQQMFTEKEYEDTKQVGCGFIWQDVPTEDE
jgi:hypothetical protein